MQLWTVREAARALGITQPAVIELVRIGFLSAFAPRGHLRIVPIATKRKKRR